jgi:hypothetical protein
VFVPERRIADQPSQTPQALAILASIVASLATVIIVATQ